MEASKRILCAMLLMGLVLNILGSVEASYIVKNSSSKDILVMPVSVSNVKIPVKAGDTVHIPSKYSDVIIKNLEDDKSSSPVKVADGTVLVCVDGVIKGTISIYLGGLVNGVISILTGLAALLLSL